MIDGTADALDAGSTVGVATANERIRELEALLAERDAVIAELGERIAELEAKAEKLRELLERNSPTGLDHAGSG